MKIITIVLAAFLLTIGIVSACHEQVHVANELGEDMEGINVQLVSTDCDWGPKNGHTHSDGWTKDWSVIGGCTYEASVLEVPQGYVCTTGTDYNDYDNGKIYLFCEPDFADTPEFSTLAAVGLIGLAGLFIYRKRN